MSISGGGNRVSGLSGFDTETMVQQLMKIEQAKVDKVKQQQQVLKWQQEMYRSSIKTVNTFRDTFFDISKINSGNYMLSPTTYASLAARASSSLKDSNIDNILSAKAQSGAKAGKHTITDVKLAGNEIWKSGSNTGRIYGDAVNDLALNGQSIQVNYGGTTKTINLENYSDADDMASKLQTQLNAEFGSGSGISVKAEANGKLSFATTDGKTMSFANEGAGKTVEAMGLREGISNIESHAMVGNGKNVYATYKADPSGIPAGSKIKLSYTNKDGVVEEKEINVGGYGSLEDFMKGVQDQLDIEFGAEKDADGKVIKSNVVVGRDANGTVRFVDSAGKEAKVDKNAAAHATLEKLGMTETTDFELDFAGIPKDSKINVTLNGMTKSIVLDGRYASVDEAIADMQAKIDDKFGSGKVSIEKNSEGKISITSDSNRISLANNSSQDKIIEKLGFTSQQTNVLNPTVKLEDANFKNAMPPGDTIQFTINDVDFSFKKDEYTVQQMIDKVNSNTDAGVKLSYTELTGTFMLESANTGAANKITMSGDFLTNTLGINDKVQSGKDASMTLDGVAITRESNNFTVDGVAYSIKGETAVGETITVGVESDTTKAKEAILKFVEEYNKMIETLNGTIGEEKNSSYKPLTDVEKEAMTEKQIELWEKNAQKGLLRNDNLLKGVTQNLRNVLYGSVPGVDMALYNMGITTSSDYRDRGKLIVNETKLDESLKNNIDEVTNLMTDPKNGIMTQFKNTIDSYTKTTGAKGLLIEKAGLEGTSSATTNALTLKINTYGSRISDMLASLVRKENAYYIQFSKVESALASMNSQSNWLGSMTGGGAA